MIGTIIGDVAGSTYEVDEIKEKRNKSKVSYDKRIKILDRSVPLFLPNSTTTDDSCLTIAIADALLTDRNYEEKLKYYGKKELEYGLDNFKRPRFGSGFIDWLNDRGRNNSYANGSSMRVSSIPMYIDDHKEMLIETEKSCMPTHNDKDAIMCTKALSETIFLAKNKYDKSAIKSYIESNYFNLNYNLEDLQRNNLFKMKAIDTVPLSIYSFLISDDFEDSIRKAISLGGDTDTIAAMTGSISENFYGVPEKLKCEVMKYIPDYLRTTIDKFYKEMGEKENVKRIGRKIK